MGYFYKCLKDKILYCPFSANLILQYGLGVHHTCKAFFLTHFIFLTLFVFFLLSPHPHYLPPLLYKSVERLAISSRNKRKKEKIETSFRYGGDFKALRLHAKQKIPLDSKTYRQVCFLQSPLPTVF